MGVATLWFQLTGKSWHVWLLFLGALASLGICQNIIHQVLVLTVSQKFSPSKILYHTVPPIDISHNNHDNYVTFW